MMQGPKPIGEGSYDWTYDVAKNFLNETGKPKIKMAFNMLNNRTLEPFFSVMTRSENRSEVLHALEDLIHRGDGADFAGLWSDIYPADKDLLRSFFPGCKGHLGVFHLLKRITDELRPRHCDNAEACAALSAAVYDLNSDDLKKVEQALSNGTMNRRCHSSAEIIALKQSGLFSKRKYSELCVFGARANTL